jgi:hypothetical protein
MLLLGKRLETPLGLRIERNAERLCRPGAALLFNADEFAMIGSR